MSARKICRILGLYAIVSAFLYGFAGITLFVMPPAGEGLRGIVLFIGHFLGILLFLISLDDALWK